MPRKSTLLPTFLFCCLMLPGLIWGTTSRGPGGGGALFSASISPHDPQLLYMSSDMSGIYRSPDFGRHWSMLHFRRLQGGHSSPVRFSADPDLLYSIHVSDELDYGSPVRSVDGGVTLEPLAGDPTEREVWFLDADPEARDRLLIADYSTLYFSPDGGAGFTAVHSGSDLRIAGVF